MMLTAYYAFCGVIAVLLFSCQTFCGVMLITPRDVGGTLFGGMFLDILCLGGWLLATAGLMVSVLMRLAGAGVALLCASTVQVTAGIWSLLTWPDDANGNLIFSPAPDEITCMSAVAGSLLFLSIYAIRRPVNA